MDIKFAANINFIQVFSCSFIDTKNPSTAIICESVLRLRDNLFSKTIASQPFSTSPTGGILNLGFNIFSNNPVNKVATDLINIDSTALALDKLGTYGGLWPVRVPKTNSPAFNSGNPNDFSPAQNGPIYGIRDRGAAERPVISNDTVSSCFGPITWWGNTYNGPGVYLDTAANANSLDSTGILVIEGLEASLANNGGVLQASANEPATFYWLDCTAGTVTDTGATFLPAVNGIYAAIAQTGTCSDTTDCISYNEVSLEENKAQSLVVYPNPTTGTIRILSRQGELPTSYRISDLQGRLIHVDELTEAGITMHNLPAGTYLVQFTWADGTHAVKRVVVAP